MTNKDLYWEPNSSIFGEQEHACTDVTGSLLLCPNSTVGQYLIINQVKLSKNVDAADLNADDNFAAVLQSNVNITVAQLSFKPNNPAAVSEISNSTNRYGTIQFNKRKQVDGDTLARLWEIYSDKVRSTVKNTTQQGGRRVLHPNLSRRYPTKDKILRYKLMLHPVFSDTLQTGMKYARGNIYGQAYYTSFRWSICHSMRKKGEAHKTLSIVFKRDGVPHRMVVDNPKEQSLGEFKRKCREADFHLVNYEPYSPWQIAAEGCIKELKKASSPKLIPTGLSKVLWDHCIELIQLIWSHTTHTAYELQGEVPKTIMTGQTTDISNICEYEWYEWVMFMELPKKEEE